MVHLEDYFFDVSEREVMYQMEDPCVYNLTENYKSIVKMEDGSLISIVPESYKIVTNKELIETCLEQLDALGVEYVINQSHSFVDDGRMKLHLEFPELYFNDGYSDINMSLYIHNSYNQVEGIRILWGAIRKICINGMIWGELMKKIYYRHRGNVLQRVNNIGTELSETYELIPELQERIMLLKTLMVSPELVQELEKALGKTAVAESTGTADSPNQWMLYNMLTYYISHNVAQHLRTQKQIALARVFNL